MSELYTSLQISATSVARKTGLVFYPKTYFNQKHLRNTLGTLLNQSIASKNTKKKKKQSKT
jgi:hypothetical protein